MEKLKLLIDVDEVICHPGLLPAMNRFMGTNYSIWDFDTYYLDDMLGSDDNKERFYATLQDMDLYEEVEFLPDAIESIRELNEHFDIYICSSCAMFCCLDKSARFFADKYNFLIKYFPFLNPEHFILTGVKNIFKADIQIDDKASHLKGDITHKLMMTAYHNRKVSDEELSAAGIVRVDSWSDIKKYLFKLINLK